MTNPESNPILVLDCGAQYSKLIARRVSTWTRLVVANCIACIFSACATSSSDSPTMNKAQFAIEAYGKAVELIWDSDWVGYSDSIEQLFTEQELRAMALFGDDLEEMILLALARGNSIYGAKLVGYFQMEECYAGIRKRVLTPSAPYWWESTRVEDAHKDQSFQYHTAYAHALMDLGQSNLAEALRLTQEELSVIHDQAKGGPYIYWASWLLRNLEQGIEDAT